MAPAKALSRLALQKRILQAESDAHRLVLASELHRVTRPLHWVDRVQLQARPVFVAGIPIAAYLLARRTKGVTRWVAAALGAARTFRSLRQHLRRGA